MEEVLTGNSHGRVVRWRCVHIVGLIEGASAAPNQVPTAPEIPSAPSDQPPQVPVRRDLPPPVPARPTSASIAAAGVRNIFGSTASLPTASTNTDSPRIRPPVPARVAPTPAPRGTASSGAAGQSTPRASVQSPGSGAAQTETLSNSAQSAAGITN